MSGQLRAVPRVEALEARAVPAAAGVFAVGAGAGGGPRVRVFDTATGALLSDFFAYEPTFTGGVTTAIGDVNADGRPDVVVGAGDGGAPRIRVFDGRAFDRIQTPAGSAKAINPPVLADFFAYESSFRNGVFVGAGNIVGLGFAEVVAGAGAGGGPRVRVFDGQQITAALGPGRLPFTGAALGDVVADYFAYDPDTRSGVRVAVTTQPALAVIPNDIVTAPGPKLGPEIRVWSGAVINAKRTAFTGRETGDKLADFFDGDVSDLSGRFVAAADFTRDGISDIAIGTGADGPARVTVYDGVPLRGRGLAFTGRAIGEVFDTFLPVADVSYQNGVTVGGAVLPAGIGANLLYGIGGDGRLGEAFGVRYDRVGSVLNRVPVFDDVFDRTFFSGVFVST